MEKMINVVKGDVHKDSTVMQIYVNGVPGFDVNVFHADPSAKAFSPEWLLFYQNNVPLVGRDADLDRLNRFLKSNESFLWWGVYGPGGVGKSRLAHDFLRTMPAGWQGGFLARDRLTIGAASRWEPEGPTLLIVDYAAAAGKELATFIEILARRMEGSPHKVRLLLLEREMSTVGGWWRSLLLNAGQVASSLRRSLYGDPFELAPMEGDSVALLVEWLKAAGWSPERACANANNLAPDYLTSLSEHGRPLLLALVAAGMFNGAETGALRTPTDVIDAYLGRELRLWRQQSRDDEQFDAVCYTALYTTLTAGSALIRSFEEPIFKNEAGMPMSERDTERRIGMQNDAVLKKMADAIGYGDIRSCLTILDLAGVSERNYWCVQPDAIGERLIQIFVRQPRNSGLFYSVFPRLSAKRLFTVGIGSIASPRSNAYRTLGRLDPADILDVFRKWIEASDKVTMRAVLIHMRWIARVSGRVFPKSCTEFFSKEVFGARFLPEIPLLMKCFYALADTSAQDEPTQQVLFGELADAAGKKVLNMTAVWMLPFMATITQVGEQQRFALLRFYAERAPGMPVARVREILVLLEFMLDSATQVISLYLEAPPPESGASEKFILPLNSALDAAVSLYRIADAYAAALAKRPQDKQDLAELGMAMASTGAQLSYLMLIRSSQADCIIPNEWHSHALTVASVGIQWLHLCEDKRVSHLCLQNALAAGEMLEPGKLEIRNMRQQLIQDYREKGMPLEFVELARDAARAADNSSDIATFREQVDSLVEHAQWIGDAAEVISAPGASSGAVARLLRKGDFGTALEFAMQYGRLATEFDQLDPSDFIDMINELSLAAADFDDSNLQLFFAYLESLLMLQGHPVVSSAGKMALVISVARAVVIKGRAPRLPSIDYLVQPVPEGLVRRFLVDRALSKDFLQGASLVDVELNGKANTPLDGVHYQLFCWLDVKTKGLAEQVFTDSALEVCQHFQKLRQDAGTSQKFAELLEERGQRLSFEKD